MVEMDFPYLALKIVRLAKRLNRWCQDIWTSRAGNLHRKHRDMIERNVEICVKHRTNENKKIDKRNDLVLRFFFFPVNELEQYIFEIVRLLGRMLCENRCGNVREHQSSWTQFGKMSNHSFFPNVFNRRLFHIRQTACICVKGFTRETVV